MRCNKAETRTPTHRDKAWSDDGIQERRFGLEGEQPIKEGSVALEQLAKILGGDVVAVAILIFQRGSLGGELLGDALDDVGDQAVGLFDRVPRLIDVSCSTDSGMDRLIVCVIGNRFEL